MFFLFFSDLDLTASGLLLLFLLDTLETTQEDVFGVFGHLLGFNVLFFIFSETTCSVIGLPPTTAERTLRLFVICCFENSTPSLSLKNLTVGFEELLMEDSRSTHFGSVTCS